MNIDNESLVIILIVNINYLDKYLHIKTTMDL